MKKIALWLLFLLLFPSFSFAAAGPYTGGGPFSGNALSASANVSNATGVLPTANGGTGNFYAGSGGTSNDCTAIQAAINSAEVAGGVVNFEPYASYTCTTGLTLDPQYVSIEGNGATITETSSTTPLFTITNSTIPNFAGSTHTLENLTLIGPGSGTTSDMFVFTASSSSYSARYDIKNVSGSAFRYGENYGNNAYLIFFYNVSYGNMSKAIYFPSGATNSGENISHYGGVIAVSGAGVDNEGGAEFNFFGTSFDFNTIQLESNNTGVVYCYQCHLETATANISGAFISVADSVGGRVSMIGGAIVVDGGDTNSTPPVAVFGNGVFSTDGTFIYLPTNTSGYLCAGTGICLINGTKTYTYTSNVIATQAFSTTVADTKNPNLLSDGGFEGTSIADFVFIARDTNAIVSRTTGANIQLSNSTDQHHSGSQSLKIVKANAGYSLAQLDILAPINSRSMPMGSFWYAKPGTQTGTVYLYYYAFEVNGEDGNGQPIITNSVEIGSPTVLTLTSSAIAWTQLTQNLGGIQLPAWANYFGIVVDLSGMNAGNFYIDDVDITQM